MAKLALVTGATGFVGSHLVDALLTGGMRVRCMVRRNPPYEWLDETAVEIVHGDLTDPEALRKAVGGVDLIYHAAAVTWAARAADYERVNAEGTRKLLYAVQQYAPGLSRFVYISSQAAGGPSHAGRPRNEGDPDTPISPYGDSKLSAERYVLACSDSIPTIILRPGAVYGPRDRAFLPIFKLLARKILIQFGSEDRLVSLCHVLDLVSALLAAGHYDGPSGTRYYVSEPRPRSWRDIEGVMITAMGVKPRRIVIGRKLLTLMGSIGQAYGAVLSRPVKVNRARMQELLETDWSLDTSRMQSELGVAVQHPVESAMQELVRWYRQKNWL